MSERTAEINYVGEDGLDNRLAKSWDIRLKREKARQRANAVVFTAALKASKVQQ